MINDIVYNVGDEVYLVKSGTDLSKVGVGNYNKVLRKFVITKITTSGYVYGKMYDKDIYFDGWSYETRLKKDGSYSPTYAVTYKLSPCRIDIDEKYNQCELEHEYIQTTFKRLKIVKSMSYANAQKINSLLDEIGVDKVE